MEDLSGVVVEPRKHHVGRVVGIVFLVFIVVIVIGVIVVNIPVQQTADIPQSELAKGKVVDCQLGGQILIGHLGVSPELGNDNNGRSVILFTKEGTMSLHLGETKSIRTAGSVTLVAFEVWQGAQAVKLLIVPDASSTWITLKSSNIPASQLAKGKVANLKLGSQDLPFDSSNDSGATFSVGSVLIPDKAGQMTVSVDVFDSSGTLIRADLHLGEARAFDGVGIVQLVAFTQIDWDQAVKLLVIPERTSAQQ
jgi:hypothetical protein